MAAATQAPVRRWGSGTAAIVRLLIDAQKPLTGVAIAKLVGVTQPRVSQVLKHLADHAAVRATDAGYLGVRARLFELYRARAQPLLVRPETHWYSLRPPNEQARRAMEKAARDDVPIAVSADAGPDLLVPWRHPTLTIIYTLKRLSLLDSGFVRAEGRVDATVTLRWTSDRTLVAPIGDLWPSEVEGIPLTHPVQQWRDLLDLGGQDRAEAADRLRRAILQRSLPAFS